MMQRRSLRIAIGLLLSAVFLVFAVRGVDLEQVRASLEKARWIYLLPTMGAVVFSFFIRAVRWRLILVPVKSVRTMNAYSATMIGFMANNVLPMRAGEFVRAVVIGKQESISKSAALATIVIERVFDVVALLLTLVIGTIGHELPDEIELATWVVAAVTVGSLVFFSFAARSSRRPGAFVERLPGGRSAFGLKLASRVDQFRDGLAVFRRPARMIVSLALSLCVWGAFVAAYYWTLLAFDLHLGLRAPILLLGVVSIGVMLPSAPGYVGTMQWFFTLAVEPFGVSDSVALSASCFFWFAQYVPVTLIGLFFFVRENVNLRSLLEERVRRGQAVASGEGSE